MKCVWVHLCMICVCGEYGAQAAEPFKNTINGMKHLLRQLRRQQRFYFFSHCIMSKAARGTPLTILMMLAEAINDAVTEQWLNFEKMVVIVVGGRLSSCIYDEYVCYSLPSSGPGTAILEESDEGAYSGVNTKESKVIGWLKAGREELQ